MDITKLDKREKRNLRHLIKPRPGDYWHEMFAPICVVVAVLGKEVLYLSNKDTVDTDDRHWTWDVEKPLRSMTLKKFRKWLCYDTKVFGHIRTWATCAEKKHKWVVNHYERGRRRR